MEPLRPIAPLSQPSPPDQPHPQELRIFRSACRRTAFTCLLGSFILLSSWAAARAPIDSHGCATMVKTRIEAVGPLKVDYLHYCSDCFRLERLAERGSHPLERAAFARRTRRADIPDRIYERRSLSVARYSRRRVGMAMKSASLSTSSMLYRRIPSLERRGYDLTWPHSEPNEGPRQACREWRSATLRLRQECCSPDGAAPRVRAPRT